MALATADLGQQNGGLAALTQRIVDHVEGPQFDPPPLPRIAQEIWAACAMGRASALQVAHIVHRDPIIAGRVMQLAVSARYGPGEQPVATLRDAIVRIGFTELLNAVLMLSLGTSLYARCVPTELGEESRRRGVAAALATSRLAAATGLGTPPRAFLAGLLHDVGEPIVLHVLERLSHADRSAPALEPGPTRELLRELHAAVGGRVIDRWQLDLELRVVVTRHHDGRPLPECSPLLRLVRLADVLADEVVPRGADAPPPAVLPADVPGVPLPALEAVRAELPAAFALYDEL
jgi:HD-like signal output (HDOD) protein